ncbi:tRNA lysidine(34) synthetase TilS [Phaeobacter sp.]|uniref:tRNA lysidine(34) synthetase TilS n=1 Tax=Phaeobacter sp. TaxID=1902409 RepID=UPI0025F257C2|nr:tRNA lysidine(34) synthetase TilS [Phaeobacter sp.]
MARADSDIHALIRRQFRSNLPEHLGVAVSGGGDSMALLYLLHDCFADLGVGLYVATVDHGLRPEVQQEAALVAEAAQSLGARHDVLQWRDHPAGGNLQEEARRARYALLINWARSHDLTTLALGHTADDQAETLLMRLGRAAGVSGLAAMPRSRAQDGISLVRPMLDITRAQLRDYLRAKNVTWAEDPSNSDTRFERVRIRQAMEALAPIGLTVDRLASVAHNLGAAREALDWYTFLAARDMVEVRDEALVVDSRLFRTLPDEIAHRLLVRAFQWIAGGDHPPRRDPMGLAKLAIRQGGSFTLAGCRIVSRAKRSWITRELKPLAKMAVAPGAVWDRRWRVYGGDATGCEIRALGVAGLKTCAALRDRTIPTPVLETTPAVWRGDDLVAAPLAGQANGWRAEPVRKAEEFFASLLSH